MCKLIWAPLLICLLTFTHSEAQSSSGTSATQTNPNAAQKDSQAVAILQKSLAALGESASTAPASIVASGTYTRFAKDSTTYPLRLKALGTDKFRREVDAPDGTHTSIIRGLQGWSRSSTGTQPLSVSQLSGKGLEDLPVLAITQWMNSPATSLQFVGTETVAGRSLSHISVKQQYIGNGSSTLKKAYEEAARCELFIDPQTYLPVRIRYYEHPRDWRVAIPVDLELSDFRLINGLEFPFTVTRYMGDQKIGITQYQSVDFNVSLTADQFQAR